MNRILLEDLHQYFEEIENKTGDEIHIYNLLTEELPRFQITSLHRDDLESRGFDVSEVADEDMRQLASKLSDDYCEQLFWESLEIIAGQGLKIPKHPCPKCGKGADRYDSYKQQFDCHSCGHSWKQIEPTEFL